MALYFYQRQEPAYDPTSDMQLLGRHFGERCLIYPTYKDWTRDELDARERLLKARVLRLARLGGLMIAGDWTR
jgi:hypothetical protein